MISHSLSCKQLHHTAPQTFLDQFLRASIKGAASGDGPESAFPFKDPGKTPELSLLVLTVLVFWSGCRWCPLHLGDSDCPPEPAFAAWPLGHLLGSAAHSSPTTHLKPGQHKFLQHNRAVHKDRHTHTHTRTYHTHNDSCSMHSARIERIDSFPRKF